MTKHKDSQPITSVIDMGELRRQLEQREAEHQRRVQSWTVEDVQELAGAAVLLDIALQHRDVDVAVAALGSDHMGAGDRRYVADNAIDPHGREAARAEVTRRAEGRNVGP